MVVERPLWVKICGIRTPTAALAARAAGADAVGFVFATSPRRVDAATARQLGELLGPNIARVGIFVDTPLDELLATAQAAGLSHVQLHGDETDEYVYELRSSGFRVIRAVRVSGPKSLANAAAVAGDMLLLDAADPNVRGGSGRSFHWDLATEVARLRPVILAGGLSPHNVGEAIRIVKPFGVDVSTGVERAPGDKDPAKIAAFISLARNAWQAISLRETIDCGKVMDDVRRAT